MIIGYTLIDNLFEYKVSLFIIYAVCYKWKFFCNKMCGSIVSIDVFTNMHNECSMNEPLFIFQWNLMWKFR